MNRRVQILPRALADIQRASRWYEERREGLGREFESAIEAALASISRFPELFPKVTDEVHRCIVGQFPFGVFYELHDDGSILFDAVFHASPDPAAWREWC